LAGIRFATSGGAHPGGQAVRFVEGQSAASLVAFQKSWRIPRRGSVVGALTLNYRALAVKRDDGFLWFWIGDHATYDGLIR